MNILRFSNLSKVPKDVDTSVPSGCFDFCWNFLTQLLRGKTPSNARFGRSGPPRKSRLLKRGAFGLSYPKPESSGQSISKPEVPKKPEMDYCCLPSGPGRFSGFDAAKKSRFLKPSQHLEDPRPYRIETKNPTGPSTLILLGPGPPNQ